MNASPNILDRRHELEEQMLKLEAEMLVLRLSYNTLSPTHHVPNEVLSRIFVIYADEIHQANFESHDGRSFSWIKIAHVCHRWRMVALGCAELWSTISFIKPELTKIMLSRSKASPISIRFDVKNRKFDKILSRLLSQTDRWRSVDLSGKYDPLVLRNAQSTTPALLLETLRIKNSALRRAELPISFLQGGTPVLRHLSLRQLTIPNWDSVPRSSLVTHFEVRASYFESNEHHLEGLLNVLRQMPLLETLILERYLSLPGDAEDINAEAINLAHPIELPSMKRVELFDNVPMIRGLMGAMRIPEAATLSAAFIDNMEELSAIEAAMSAITAAWRRKGNPLATKDLIIRQVDSPMGAFLAFKFRRQSFNIRVTPDIEPDLTLSFMHPRYRIAHYLSTFTKSTLDLAPLESFEFQSSRQLHQNEWDDVFGPLPSLEKVTLVVSPCFTFAQALVSANVIRFPALKRVVFEGLNFDHAMDHGWLGYLTNSLSSRPVSHRIERLDIRKCEGVDHDIYEFIIESVPRLMVIWDELEGEPEESEEEESEDEWEEGEESEGEEEQ